MNLLGNVLRLLCKMGNRFWSQQIYPSGPTVIGGHDGVRIYVRPYVRPVHTKQNNDRLCRWAWWVTLNSLDPYIIFSLFSFFLALLSKGSHIQIGLRQL